MHTAISSVLVWTNGGKDGGFGKRERDHLLHDPQNQLGATGDVELLEKPVQVHVNGVRRNLELFSNRRLVLIVENALDNLQFAPGDFQRAANLKPSMIGEQ